MKKVFFVLRTEFSQSVRQTKLLTIVFFLVILYESVFASMGEVCRESQFVMQWTEPFILLCTRSTNIMLLPLIYVFLLSGFPYCKTQFFQMIRTGKQRWFWGEFLFLLVSALLLTVLLFAGSIVFLSRYLTNTPQWSDFMTNMNRDFPELYTEHHLLFLDASILTHGEPVEVFLYTFLMIWLYLVIIGVCLLLGTILGKHIIAMIASVGLTIIGGSAIYIKGWVQWLFPLVHVEFGLHFDSFFSKVYFPLWGSVLYLAGLLAVLVILCECAMVRMKVGGEP